jgi:hypothetical protein
MRNWMMPPQDAKSVLASLTAQSERHQCAKPPTPGERERVLKKIEHLYPNTPPPQSLAGSVVDWVALRKEIHFVLDNDVNQTASPGTPLKNEFQEVQKISVQHREMLVDMVIQRITRLKNQPQLYEMTPSEMVLAGLYDPVFLFVKGEPHPQRKIKTQTWRLISAVSIVDQVIDRILHSTQNNTEIGIWYLIPSKPGIGFSDGGARKLQRDLHRHAGDKPFAQADVQGWDWSVQGWELDMEAEARIRLMRAQATVAARLIRARNHCLKNPVYALNDGSMYAQDYEGVVKSGTYCTSSSNSRIRVMAAYLVGAEWCIANGDDSIEDPVDGAAAKYAALGHTLRDYTSRSGEFEFCSRLFKTNGESVPTDPTKSLYLLCSKKITLERVEAYVDHIKDLPFVADHVHGLLHDNELDFDEEAYEFLQSWQ